MSTEATEFVTFTGSEAYTKQPEEAFKPTAAVLCRVPGLIYIHAGPTVEDPAQGHLFMRWVSLQAHIDFTKSPLFDEFRKALDPIMAGPLEKELIDFRKDPAQAFAAPVTEVARLTLREGHAKEQIAPILDELLALTLEGVISSTWGWCAEAKSDAVIVTGWKSPEAHALALQSASDDIRELVGKSQEHVEVKVVHSKLIAF